MKALFIIPGCIALALILKVMDILTSRKNIASVGAKSNKLYRNMPKIDITDEEQLRKALEYYKGLPD